MQNNTETQRISNMSKIKTMNGDKIGFQSETISIIEDIQCGLVSIGELRKDHKKTLANMMNDDGSINIEQCQKFLSNELDKQRIEDEIYRDLTIVCKTLRMASNPENTARDTLGKQMARINDFLMGGK